MVADDLAQPDHGQDLAQRRARGDGIFASLQRPSRAGDLDCGHEHRGRPDDVLVLEVRGDLRQAGAVAQDHRGGGALPRLGTVTVEGPQAHHRDHQDRHGEGRQGAGGDDREPASKREPWAAAAFQIVLAAGHVTWVRTRAALVPPKPKLLDRAIRMVIGLDLWGTRSIGV